MTDHHSSARYAFDQYAKASAEVSTLRQMFDVSDTSLEAQTAREVSADLLSAARKALNDQMMKLGYPTREPGKEHRTWLYEALDHHGPEALEARLRKLAVDQRCRLSFKTESRGTFTASP
ncbi:MAG: hypothetical protein IT371_10010 [Deltaproteobacteria bacterium]|nr:hypothetical protein [Deltaproteobacteria bacterium]